MATVLIVDDERDIVDLVSIHLTREGFATLKAYDGIEALKLIDDHWPDIAIVDVMMPKMDGFTLTKKLRDYDIPVLLLTAKSSIEDKEAGFLAGTDDYVVKPFEPKELIFRVRAILRRYDKDTSPVIHVGPLQIDRTRYDVTIEQVTYMLPLKEFELLSTLATKPMQVFTRDYLIERVWGLDYSGDGQTLNVHIKRLREKLRKATDKVKITTIRGVGYKLEVEENE